jgi:hypothetical protein
VTLIDWAMASKAKNRTAKNRTPNFADTYNDFVRLRNAACVLFFNSDPKKHPQKDQLGQLKVATFF